MSSGGDFIVNDPNTEFANKYPNGLTLRDLLPFYEAVEKDEPIKLQWTCPGRVKPQQQQKQESADTSGESASHGEEVNKEQQQDNSNLVDRAKLAEFDFDEPSSSTSTTGLDPHQRGLQDPTNLTTPTIVRRSTVQPRQPRVASMNKILDDMRRSRLSSSSSPPPQPHSTHARTIVDQQQFSNHPPVGEPTSSDSQSTVMPADHEPGQVADSTLNAVELTSLQDYPPANQGSTTVPPVTSFISIEQSSGQPEQDASDQQPMVVD